MTVSRDHYYRLASDLEAERIESASQLLNELAESNSDQEYDYALDRLIKGLSSSRASARIGFSTCLTELLSILFANQKYSVDRFLVDLDAKIRATISKNNGKNERAILFGKIFGYQALLNCHIFTDPESSAARSDEFIRIICEIVDLSLSKSWIRESCFVTLVQSVRGRHDTSVWAALISKTHESNLSLTCEGLLLMLSIPASQRAAVVLEAGIEAQADGTRFWKNSDPLSKGNIQLLGKVLKESHTDDAGNGENQQQKGSWQPRLHHVWPLLLSELVEIATTDNDTLDAEETKSSKKRSKHSTSPKKKRKLASNDRIQFEEFWKSVIDEQFFSSNASAERKYWGFEILRLAFKLVRDDQTVHAILSPNLMRSLINQTAKNDRFLNKIGKIVLEELVELSLRDNHRYRVAILSILLKSKSGSCNFDALTKSKTCESIISKEPDSTLLGFFLQWLDALDPSQDDFVRSQIFIVDQVLLVLKNGSTEDVVMPALRLFVKLAFFIPIGQNDDFNLKISDLATEKLKSVLVSISKNWPEFGISSVLVVIKELESPDSGLKLRAALDEELAQIKDEAASILEALKLKTGSASEKERTKAKCFEMLYSVSLLQLYAGDEDSIALMPELNVAFAKQFTDVEDEEEAKEERAESNEILTDILLTFVSQNSTLMKQLAFVIWEFLIADGLDKSTIDTLADVLTTKENKEGQEKLFSNNADVEMEEGEEHHHSDEEDGEDEEEEEDEEDEEEAKEESEDDDDLDNEMEEVDQKTNIALAKALGIPASESGEVKFDSDDDSDASEDDDEDGSESEAESMSDDQMMAIDSQLSQIFQQRKSAMDEIRVKSGNQRKLDVEDAKLKMIFFKNRILDLVEKFNDVANTSMLNFEFVLPLLDLIELTTDKNLGEKAHRLLKNHICKSKVQITDKAAAKKNLPLLIQQIQERATKSSIKAHSLSCNQCCVFVAKVWINSCTDAVEKGEVLDALVDVYADAIKKWYKNPNDKTQPSMFSDFINWLNSKR